MRDKVAKAGKLLCVDTGEYSDYGVVGFFVVLQDFYPLKELQEFLEANPKQKKKYHFEHYDFLGFLAGKGYLLQIDYDTLYLGGYSSYEQLEFRPH